MLRSRRRRSATSCALSRSRQKRRQSPYECRRHSLVHRIGGGSPHGRLFCLGVFDDAKERGYIGAGFCPGGYGLMMKRVLAAKDDQVAVTPEGVTVNGQLLPFSVPLASDKAGRELPRYQSDRYTLGNAELLLMSDVSGTSFDGRYYGPINRNQIEAVIRPIFTW
ncbi:conjugative transfer signal peptidase TraF [Stutzerimonas kunmingensis]|uniref:conjugative transfer signal peptidase TraF n=1 Tax=Stutzerimonas kunmingensis TaxID=1211807 RepID=UPI00406C7D25